MNILLDTNVILDYLTKINVNYINMEKIVNSCVNKQNQGFITSHSITDFYYITRKYMPDNDRKEWTKFIVNTFTILTEDKETFLKCLNAEYLDDLEDQLQMECSAAADLDYIITRNLKDFQNSKVPAVSSEEFLEM